ncbi:MAG: adenylyl-sulfate kinase [Alphaproteobacteria bacterium]
MTKQNIQNIPLKLALVGHVDHGKSSLVGRLFYEADALVEGKFEAIQEMCKTRGMPFEWAFLMDALKAERDQGVTIDTAQIPFETAGRSYTIIDAPGHKEFLKNMITGAANADAALLVIDAEEGMQEQSRRHGFLLHLLKVSQVIVVINKMDLVDYYAARFAAVVAECRAYLESLGMTALAFVPASAKEGDNIGTSSEKLAWFEGKTLLEALQLFHLPRSFLDLPLRLPVQDVYKFDQKKRMIAGRIESGQLHVGDQVLFSPSNKEATIASIESFPETVDPVVRAGVGQSVAVTLDEQIFIERGAVMSHRQKEILPFESRVFRARIFWLGKTPLTLAKTYTLKLGTMAHPVVVEEITRVVSVDDFSEKTDVESVAKNEIADVVLRTQAMLAFDSYHAHPVMGRFVLVDGYDVAGGGTISVEGYPNQRMATTVRATNVRCEEHHISKNERIGRNNHENGILWLTGLSGSGKSTLALSLERELFQKGYQVYVLDGDNMRHGLCSDLGFSPEERTENIRRVGEVARLFAAAGFLVITAFISPYRSDRQRVQEIAGDLFHEVHIEASLETCEGRDTKGLYKKARAGLIQDFTGISAPYEAPENAELILTTDHKNVEESLEELVQYVAHNFALKS